MAGDKASVKRQAERGGVATICLLTPRLGLGWDLLSGPVFMSSHLLRPCALIRRYFLEAPALCWGFSCKGIRRGHRAVAILSEVSIRRP